jgi:hypothetical protein
MKFKRTVLAVSVSAAVASLTACGGGGGGGSPSPIIRSNYDVPYYTPTRVGSVTPVNSNEREYDSSALFAQSLSGSSQQELIVAGRMQPDSGTYQTYNLSIFGWSNGNLIDKTSVWFNGSDNRIIGTEPSVKFADFNGDGRTDMFVAANTDSNVVGVSAVFMNSGNGFTRTNLPNPNSISAHDSAVYDMNGDGYADIFMLSGRSDSMISFGSSTGTFTTYSNISSVGNGSGVAIADFLGNGTSTMIITDVNGSSNRLYSWAISSSNLYITELATLPTPRFLLPKWSSYGFTSSHDIRALAFDFDNSGRTSAIIISRPEKNGTYPQYSEVQFLKNQGGGLFTDVTDSVLVGYNTSAPASYNPKLMDVNGDGLTDIVLSSPNWTDNSGSQVLIHTSEHKYVASYAAVLKAFQDQSLDIEKAINANANYGGNGIVFVQGPNGDMYLATAISYVSGNVQQKAIYLSKLGGSVTNAQATANSIRQTWPWMSSAQVNTILAQSSTTWFGLNVLDSSKALQPIGELKLFANNRLMSLNGSLGGINLNGSANQVKVLDSIGRDFNINYSATNYQGPNQWSRMIDSIDDDTRGAQLSGMQFARHNGFKFGGTEDNRYIALGITGIEISRDTTLSVQYSRLPFSPFVQINGSWGLVKSSSTMETTITKRHNGFVDKLGIMYSATEIDPGLITRVNPITSVWAETGYEWGNFKMYGGVLPKVVSGSADITLPTGIDNTGRISYTNTRAEVHSPTVTYARVSYSDRINKHVTYRINGMFTSQQQHNIVGEVKVNF